MIRQKVFLIVKIFMRFIPPLRVSREDCPLSTHECKESCDENIYQLTHGT